MKPIMLTNNIFYYHKAHKARRKVTNQSLSYYIDCLSYERSLKFIKKLQRFLRNGSRSPLLVIIDDPIFLKNVLDKF
jgi:hypothetical protein